MAETQEIREIARPIEDEMRKRYQRRCRVLGWLGLGVICVLIGAGLLGFSMSPTVEVFVAAGLVACVAGAVIFLACPKCGHAMTFMRLRHCPGCGFKLTGELTQFAGETTVPPTVAGRLWRQGMDPVAGMPAWFFVFSCLQSINILMKSRRGEDIGFLEDLVPILVLASIFVASFLNLLAGRCRHCHAFLGIRAKYCHYCGKPRGSSQNS